MVTCVDLMCAEDPIGGASSRPVAKLMPAEIVARAEEIVLDRLPHRVPSPVLARTVGVSIAEMNAAFRLQRGAPFYTALIWLRLDAVDRLLRKEPSLSEQAVAQRCGFGHYGVFLRNYRLRFGRDPGRSVRLDPPGDPNGPDDRSDRP